MKMVKMAMKKIVFGVSIGCFSFVSMLFLASFLVGGANVFFASRTGEQILTAAACFVMIAVGYSVGSLIYKNEKLAISLKIGIHMAVGTSVFLAVSLCAGWIAKDAWSVVVYCLLALGIAALFWGGFMVFFRYEARRINKKIKESGRD